MVIWVIGLSGAGKTTFSQEVVDRAKPSLPNLVWIDGDVARAVFGQDLDHTIEGRKANADRICRLCQFLDQQGIDVVCSILSIFQSSRDWNRENYSSYFEVYIDTPIDTLIERDPKGLYKKALSDEIKDFPGISLPFEPPSTPDLTLHNDGNLEALLDSARSVADMLCYVPQKMKGKALLQELVDELPKYSFAQYGQGIITDRITKRNKPSTSDMSAASTLDKFFNALGPAPEEAARDNWHTATTLTSILCRHNASDLFNETDLLVLNRLQTEFEIHGGLYEWHGPTTTCRSGLAKDALPYSCLSLALMLRYRQMKTTNCLNSALKLNDLLTNYKHDMTDREKQLVNATLAFESILLEGVSDA